MWRPSRSTPSFAAAFASSPKCRAGAAPVYCLHIVPGERVWLWDAAQLLSKCEYVNTLSIQAGNERGLFRLASAPGALPIRPFSTCSQPLARGPVFLLLDVAFALDYARLSHGSARASPSPERIGSNLIVRPGARRGCSGARSAIHAFRSNCLIPLLLPSRPLLPVLLAVLVEAALSSATLSSRAPNRSQPFSSSAACPSHMLASSPARHFRSRRASASQSIGSSLSISHAARLPGLSLISVT